MKNAIRKITAILMAFVVMFSTMSFTINSHFCGGSLVGVSYFSKAKSCGMKMEQKNNLKDCSISKKDCCKDVTKIIEGQQNLKNTSFDALSFNQQLFIATFYYSNIHLFEGLPNKENPFNNYTPPLIIKDIQLLDEVYLI